jgi:hypothetical protein
MANEEAAFSRKHSAVSENQNQNQKRSTTEHTEATEATERGKTTTQDHVQALAHKLAQTYEELSRLLERNPGMKRQMTEGDAREDKIYQRLKQRLKMADMAPRCQWVRQDGTACRSPQMKQHIYCFAHKQMAAARELMLMIPVVEDANAIQVGLMRIQKALIEDTISMKKAGLLLYSMQLAMTNVGQTTFGQAKDEEMVRETVDEDEAFREKAVSNQHSAISQGQNQNQQQRPLTTKDTKDTVEEQGLPRINADERGFENPKPIFWKPTPDMYRMDTPEGREAYEASLRVKIGASGHGAIESSGHGTNGTPPRAAVPHEHGLPHEQGGMHNSSLRAERLPKGPRFANELLDADTGLGSVFQTEPYANLG